MAPQRGRNVGGRRGGRGQIRLAGNTLSDKFAQLGSATGTANRRSTVVVQQRGRRNAMMNSKRNIPQIGGAGGGGKSRGGQRGGRGGR
eukprot:CAMPEP_0182416576 /NCGR_PEP_ID=MMETSP1167-20130531/925_1 /TAXON_ID=2988 /ORGANISM="Mallomonas Sp, Strain CCMP3275" /LENGTH=87 /DNA_ID=CAMNT_0024589481 /DNA_START=107 /DNA_END=366 /DNA_ORIENTATION=+